MSEPYWKRKVDRLLGEGLARDDQGAWLRSFTRSPEWTTLDERTRMMLQLILESNIPRDPAGQTEPAEASGRVQPIPDPTSENVRAERQRRIAGGQSAGYGALAKHFMTSETTIRRRLGATK